MLDAAVVKLVYTYALGAYAARREGSSPFIRTRLNVQSRPLGATFYDLSCLWYYISNIQDSEGTENTNE